GWGREDTDFANRALFHGLKVKHVRCGCIGYHLWHQECSRDRLSVNDELLKQTLRSKQAVCEHGYLQTEI
ncbi:galactosyltransferase-related protein, partial [Vibrio fluvialis]